MHRLALGVTYHGGAFHGWQRQSNVATVQGALETAISKVANEPVTTLAAGRTDAGVHATGQVAVFSTSANRSLTQWLRGINSCVVQGIQVDWVRAVADEFHPRFDAVSRRYIYLFNDHARSPLTDGLVWNCDPLDAELMQRAGRDLLGEHDFSGFRAAGCQSSTPWRRINRCEVIRCGAYVALDIEANAFLLHMVRNIARSLHDAAVTGREDLPEEILLAQDRTRLGATAPPQGLYLVGAKYTQCVFPQGAIPPLVARALLPS
jgi:tRNA pseudouridine38-40 synthase